MLLKPFFVVILQFIPRVYIHHRGHKVTSYSKSWKNKSVAFSNRHKIIIFDDVSFVCSRCVKKPTNTSIVWLFWGLRLPPGTGLQIVKHMIYWPGASWQGPGQVTDWAKETTFFSPCHYYVQPTCMSRVVISTTQTNFFSCTTSVILYCIFQVWVGLGAGGVCQYLTAVLHHFPVLKWNTWQRVVVMLGSFQSCLVTA